ncbi:adhesion G-protein coupled receptor G7-like [Nelusetta ayraudi]|uniref:adhesion G-protein coupled receptor G7-like n=1 Tax=Nelusetta ayraudi TaxID=303726 RepID=UPI003F71491D
MGNGLVDALIYINLTTGGTSGRKTASNISLGFVLYQNDGFFRTPSYNKQRWSSGRVLAASVGGHEEALHHVELHFNPSILNDTSLHDYACVSWDYNLEDWCTKGCKKINSSMTVGCFCNHATNFAVLWSYSEKYQYRYLDYISMAGLIISAVALVITIVHHLKVNVCKTARERQGNFHAKLVLLYIYTTLLAFILLFLCGSDNHHKSYNVTSNLDLQTNKIPENSRHVEPDAGPCTAITALLHYFLLATFTWNSVYGTQLVLLLRSLRSSLPPYWTRLSHVVGWGLPAVIMAITLGATYSVNNPLNYRQEEFCWLAGVDQNKQFDFAKPMFWGFLLPVSLILVYNAVLLVVTALTTCKIDPKLRSTKKTTLWKKFLVCFSLAVLLGLSWSLGYLVLVSHAHAHHVLSIIFCIFQTTQGLQIFIFFTARTPTFRAALKHSGHTITSASLARAQTYYLWENFKKALSFESYKKWENSKSESTAMSEMNTSASCGEEMT